MTRHPKLKAIKRRLKSKGWSQPKAASECGVTFEHLNRVLNGHRESARLLSKVEALPNLQTPAAV